MATATVEVRAGGGRVIRLPRLTLWYAWLIGFYCAWAALNQVGEHWSEVREHWPIALAMALGSFVAGSTPMGGGTVGFPVLVLFFDLPASLGRNFGLSIQAIGMTSASIFILCRRIAIERRVLGLSIPGSAFGLLVGTFALVPAISDEIVKLVFACMWMGFGVLTLVKNREFCELEGVPIIRYVRAAPIGLSVGFLGGLTTSLTGVGIDMLLYTVLILLYRMDVKVAVPTSVIVMAVSSVMGSGIHLGIGDLGRDVFYHWAAAAPVVILGAPLGALVVNVIPRSATLYCVAALCVLQFFWTLYQVEPSYDQWLFVGASLASATFGLTLLYRVGRSSATTVESVAERS